MIGNDDVHCVGGAATFDTPNAGTGKVVTAAGLSLTGAQAGNYVLSNTTATTTASITQLALTPIVTAMTKPYDGTASGMLATCSLTGVAAGDDVKCSGAVAFDNANAGTGKTVAATGLALTGPSSGNYVLSSSSSTTQGTITPGRVSAIVMVANKPYDGTTSATASCTPDVRTATPGSITLGWDPNPAGDQVLGYVVQVGTALGVYTQSFDVGNQTSFVYSNAVQGQGYYFTVAAVQRDGIGGNSEVSGYAEPSGVVGAEAGAVTCAGVAAFDTASPGAAKNVIITGLTLGGPAAANYELSSQTTSATATITQAAPVITWATPAGITYGAALSATQLNATTPVAGTFAYSSPLGTVLNAGSHTLTATFTPADAENYTTATATVTLVVAQATPAITWATPADLTYGTALSATQLNATANTPGRSFTARSPGRF